MQALGGQDAWMCWGPAEHVANAEMSWQSWVGLRAALAGCAEELGIDASGSRMGGSH